MATGGGKQPGPSDMVKLDKALVLELTRMLDDETFEMIKFYFCNNPIDEQELQPLKSRIHFMKLWDILHQKNVIGFGNYDKVKECLEPLNQEELGKVVEKYEKKFPSQETEIKRPVSPATRYGVSETGATSQGGGQPGAAEDRETDPKLSTQVDDDQGNLGLKAVRDEPKKTVIASVRDNERRPRTSSESIEDKRIGLIRQLGLSEYFPKKLSVQKLMCKPVPGPENGICKQLPWVMLWKLITIDYNGRNCDLSSAGAPQAEAASANTSFDGDSADEYATFIENLASTSGTETCQDTLHPMDVFLALFACCDDMLRQTLVQKMNMCRLAVPFILEDAESGMLQMCLWSMRTIVPEWRASQTGVAHEASIVNQPMDIISFIRINNPAMSKSRLLNDVISDQSQSQPTEGTFFHGDCIGGRRRRKLANGFIEASWNLPTGKDDSLAQRPVMFLNLRGNAIDKRRQLRVMTSISSAVVVLVDFSDLLKEDVVRSLKYIHGTNSHVILVVTSPERAVPSPAEIREAFSEYFERTSGDWKKCKPIFCFLNNSIRSSGEITREIRVKVTEVLEPEGRCRSLEAVSSLARKQGIIIDEDDVDCQRGKALAQQITSKMDGKSLKECKEDMLPLQGPSWLKWCEQQRQQLRSDIKGNGTSHEEREKLQNEKLKIRRKQLKRFQYRSQTMQLFTETLYDNIDNLRTVSFFIQWLRLYLDNRSRETLPALRKQYMECLTRLRVAKGKAEPCTDLEALKNEIAKAGQDLLDASFGLEHLLREAGQIYEAAVETAEHQSQEVLGRLPNYPEFAAKLLLQGHPIEIMDGNASVVPLCWVQSIFRSLRQIVGNKKIFVVSALGIQSSGKSTLLNTMFGLQFPVSAGRCTRGLYMQLFAVDRDQPFDYVVVIDTEGLRAPELGSDNYDHDNELATLVIGLGDVTILNIKGENIAEMKDVLQIVVHAFLRMKIVNKQINLQQSCIFIYQNVAAVGASEQMMQGRHQLLESLDEMTKQAAKQENLTDVTTFKKVIDFNEDKHVWCFSDLWQGDPPMAPANPGYSKWAKEVRDCIINDIARNRQAFLTIGDMETHIGDLWKGILSEDFVFSFRSSLSITAYVKLEGFFRELQWELKNDMFQWLQGEAKMKIDQCENEEDLREKCIVLGADMEDKEKDCQKMVEGYMKQLNDYFEDDNLRYISIQWKEEKKATLVSMARTCVSEGKEEITRLGDVRRVDLGSDRKDIECMIQEKANQLAGELRGSSLSDMEIRREFQNMWADVMKRMNLKRPRDCSMQIAGDVERVLREWFFTESIHLRPELEASPLLALQGNEFESLLGSMDHLQLSEDHLSIIQGPSFVFESHEEQVIDMTKHLDFAKVTIEDILKNVDHYLSENCTRDDKFQRRFAEEIVKMVAEGIEGHNKKVSEAAGEFIFRPNIKVRLAVHVCRFATQTFIQMQRDYDHKHGLMGKLESFEGRIWRVFESTVRNREVEIIAADVMEAFLRDAVGKVVLKQLPWEMVQDTCRFFNNNKFFLMTEILQYLAIKDNFGYYSSYIRGSADFAFLWLKQFMVRRYFPPMEDNMGDRIRKDSDERAPRGYLKIRQLWAEKVLESFEQALNDTHNYIQAEDHPTIEQWLHKLCSFKLGITVGLMQSVLQYKVTNFDNLHQELTKRLDAIKKTVLNDMKITQAKSVKWETQETPYTMAFNILWGCKEQCPFCSAPCRWGDDKTHRHQCMQHRPEGVSGQQWLNKRELLIETCNYNVQSNLSFRCMPCTHETTKPGQATWHKYRDYVDYYPDWDIAPNPAPESNEYWMWFMARFLEKLTGFHQAEDLPELPQSWYQITKDQAIQSLRKN